MTKSLEQKNSNMIIIVFFSSCCCFCYLVLEAVAHPAGEAKGTSALPLKFLRKFNSKMQAFKLVLDLTWSKEGEIEGAGQFNSTGFQFLPI